MRARRIAIALIIIVLPVGFMYETLADDRPLAHDDAALMTYPLFRALDDSLGRGELYLWENRQWCGLPTLASSEIGALYPPNLLLAWLLPWMSALHAGYWLHLTLAAAGTFWLGRKLGATRGAAIVAAAAFAFSGYHAAHLVQIAQIVGLAYVPLLPALLQTALERNSGRWWGLFAVVAAVAFAGSAPEVFAIAVITSLLWLIFGHDWRGADRPLRTHLLPLLLAIVVTGFLAAPQLLPMIEWATAGEAPRTAYRLHPLEATDLIRMLLPGFYGTAQDNLLGGGEQWRAGNLFVGATPLLLAVAGFGVAFRRRGWGFCIALFVVGVALAATRSHTGLPDGWLILPLLALALLSALAITHLPQATRRARAGARRMLLILGALIVLFTLLLWALFAVDADGGLVLPGRQSAVASGADADPTFLCMTGLEPLLLLGATVLTCLLAVRLAAGQRAGAVIVLALLLAALGPQWYLWQQTNPTVPRAYYSDAPATVNATRGGRVATLPADVVAPGWSVPGETRIERAMNARELLPPALATGWGTWHADGHPRLRATRELRALRELWLQDGAEAFAGAAETRLQGRETHHTPAERMKRLHRLSHVHHLVTPGAIEDPDLLLTHSGIANVYSYREPSARWWLARETVIVADRAAQLETLMRDDVDPERQVVLEHEVELNADPDAETGVVYPVAGTATSFTLCAIVPEPRVLVLADACYPGWSVAVHGEPAELLRANYAFRAVVVPAGAHNVTFSFRPASWGSALPLFGIGLLVVIALMLWPRREPPREGLTRR